MSKRLIILMTATFVSLSLYAEDWTGIAVPVDPGAGNTWELQPQSDDFNYVHPTGGSLFFDKWTDFYHNGWTGPGLTVWDRDHVFVTNDQLQIPASRLVQNNVDKISTGCITSTTRVQYPVYVEARVKISNSVLANDVWLLSPDDTQEIDIIEAYGASYSEGAGSSQTWYAQRAHVSHHVFIRNPFTDWQPNEFTTPGMPPTWITKKENGQNILWRSDYHRFGVYWKDPWHIYYYIDGVLVTQKEGPDEIDPLYHTNATNPGDTENDTRTGISKAMDIIINVEDQDWRSNNGVTPTDNELANGDHVFKVDWIRVYKPVLAPPPPPIIDSVQVDAGEVTMVVSNGVSDGYFNLLSSSNLVAGWSTNPITFQFDAAGMATVTNPALAEQELFRIRTAEAPASNSPEIVSFDRISSDWSGQVDAPSVSGNYWLNNQNADSVNAHIMQVASRGNLQMFHGGAGDGPHIIKSVFTVQDASDVNQAFRVVSFNWYNLAGTNGEATLSGYSGGISGTLEWRVSGNASIDDLVTTATTGSLSSTIDTIVWETPDYIDEVWGSSLDNLSIRIAP